VTEIIMVMFGCPVCRASGYEVRMSEMSAALGRNGLHAHSIAPCWRGHDRRNAELSIMPAHRRTGSSIGVRLRSYAAGRPPSSLDAASVAALATRVGEVREAFPDARVLVGGLPAAELVSGLSGDYVYDSVMLEALGFRRYREALPWFRRFALRLEEEFVRLVEGRVATGASIVLCTSAVERDQFQGLVAGGAQVIVVRNGADVPDALSEGWEPNHTILYTGSPEYGPNLAAIRDIAERVLPLIPAVSLVVTGAIPSGFDPVQWDRVAFTGLLESVVPVMRSALALVMPLRTGGGTRVKALEALANGLPVISTAFGVEGLGLTAGRDFIRAETPEEFARAIEHLRAHLDERMRLRTHAYHYVKEQLAWPVVLAPLVTALRDADVSGG
jgi:glycosyltransferase involved in cell wall biosynthesis